MCANSRAVWALCQCVCLKFLYTCLEVLPAAPCLPATLPPAAGSVSAACSNLPWPTSPILPLPNALLPPALLMQVALGEGVAPSTQLSKNQN